MIPQEHDKPVRDLIAKVYLPPDLCPSDPKDIEAMLDAAGGAPLGKEQVDRMLKKARGELPVGEREEQEGGAWNGDMLSEAERELVALHRNEGDDLPPEVEELLRRLRERARTEEVDGDDELES